MKKTITFFIVALVSLLSLKANAQWAQVNLGTTNKLSAVSIPENNSSIVWIVGENSISGAPYLYKSTNSGVNFTAITSFPSGFYAPRGLFSIGNDSILVWGYPGIIFSSNGGTSWGYPYNSSGADTSMFVSFCVTTTSAGWAVGNVVVGQSFTVPIVIRCANLEGTSSIFKRLTLPGSWSTYRLTSVWAKDSNNCVISTVTSNPGVILKTTNGGINWTNYSIPMETWCMIGDDVNDDIIGVGQSNGASTIYKSTNFGSTWNNLYTNSGTGVLYATGEGFIRDTMYAVGQNGMVARSVNGGSTWAKQTTGIANNLNGVYNGHHLQKFAIAVGDNGTMIRTTNAGVWVNNISSEIPEKYMLYQNYPNPFNPETNIEFAIPVNSYVTIKIYDVLGKEVATLVNEHLKAGTYRTQWNASQYSNGVYFYRFITDVFSDTKRMLLIK